MVAATLLGGCGGAQPPADPDPAPAPAATDPEPEVAETAEPEPEPGPREPSNVDNNQDYEIADRDCRALAKAYARSWRLDELKKVPSGLTADQRTEVENDLETSSSEMREQYLGQCRNTVGTAYPIDNLKCAMKAKSMQRFDDCMAGQF